MKKILLLFCLACICACSDDDGPKQTQKKYLTEMTFTDSDGTEVFNFEYDTAKNITAIRNEEDYDMLYTYTGTQLNTITTSDDEEVLMTFIYTDGKLTGYTSGGTYGPITYNQQSGHYIFGDNLYELALQDRDIATISAVDGDAYYNMDFDPTFKGPLYNVPTQNIFLMNLFSNFYPFLFVRPATHFTYQQDSYTYENTYDKDGYLTKIILTINDGSSYTVNYSYETL